MWFFAVWTVWASLINLLLKQVYYLYLRRISQILYNECRIHLSNNLYCSLASATNPKLSSGQLNFLFRLAPDWVYPAMNITVYAVSSYLTFSPLPLWRFIFCDTSHPSFTLSLTFARNPALWCPDFPLQVLLRANAPP